VSSTLRADEVIGIDLGTTNSCVALMEGKVRARSRPPFAHTGLEASCIGHLCNVDMGSE
jgi:hypothetical protein